MNCSSIYSIFGRLALGMFLACGVWCSALYGQSLEDMMAASEPAAEEEPLEVEEDYKAKVAEIEAMWVAHRDGIVNERFSDDKVIDFIESRVRSRSIIKLKDVNGAMKTYNFGVLRIPGRSLKWREWNDGNRYKSKQQIVDDVREEATQKAYETINPEARKERIVQEAAEKFKMYKMGDPVYLQLRGGVGVNSYIEGLRLRALTDEYILLGKRQVIRQDLSDEDQAKFYMDMNTAMKEEFIRNQMGKVQVEIESMIDNECYRRTSREFINNMYVPDATNQYANLHTAKPEYWISMKDFVVRLQKSLKKIASDELDKNEKPQFMRDNGLIEVPTEDNPEVTEWITENEQQRREALKQQQMMNPGMDGMGPGMGPGMPPPPM